MSKRSFARFIVLGIVVLVLTSLAGVTSAQEEVVLRMVSGQTDVPTIDPAQATDTQSNDIVTHVFVELTRLNEVTTELEPGFATSWDVDEAARTYTFHLMEGVPWVRFNPETGQVEQVLDENGNVRYVTAHDFAYSWRRHLDPAFAAEYSYLQSEYVVGGTAYNSGEGSVDDLGVAALDDHTLQITVPEGYVRGYTPSVLGMWPTVATPQWAIEEYGDAGWTEVGNYQTFGPFTVSEWVHDEKIVMVRNPFWPGTEYIPVPQIDRIEQYIIDATAAMSLYEAGDIEYILPPLAEMDRIKADPELSQQLFIGPQFCTYYYGFNVTKEPLNNVHLRRALSFAVDRQSLIDNVLKGGQLPAQWFARPGLAASPTMDTNPDLGVWYDPAIAQEELALALADLGLSSAADLPDITLMHNTLESHARIAQAIQQMWVDELGIPVIVANQEWASYLDKLNNDPPQVWRLGWCNDYVDANNFDRDVFRSTSTNNHTEWANEAYDALVDEAAVVSDLEARRDLYAQAEEILVYEDAAIIPIYWYTTVSLTKPNVERTFAVTGQNRYEKWSLGG